jgi:hypothetical protein
MFFIFYNRSWVYIMINKSVATGHCDASELPIFENLRKLLRRSLLLMG